MAVTETVALALAGLPTGWLVEVASADEALDIVHGTVPRAREAGREERLVLGAELSASWARL